MPLAYGVTALSEKLRLGLKNSVSTVLVDILYYVKIKAIFKTTVHHCVLFQGTKKLSSTHCAAVRVQGSYYWITKNKNVYNVYNGYTLQLYIYSFLIVWYCIMFFLFNCIITMFWDGIEKRSDHAVRNRHTLKEGDIPIKQQQQ